jgi:hypothetical protein
MKKTETNEKPLDQKLQDIRGIHLTAKGLDIHFSLDNALSGACLKVELRGHGHAVPMYVAKYIMDILNQSVKPIVQDLRTQLQDMAETELRYCLTLFDRQSGSEDNQNA